MKISPGFLIYLLVSLAFFLFAPRKALADYYFSDEFNQERSVNTLDTNRWTTYPNQLCGGFTNIKESGGFAKLTQCTNVTRFPYVVSKTNPFPAGNWSTEIAFTYTTVTNWGTGIALAEQAPANGGSFSSLLTINVWQDKTLVNMRVTYSGTDVYTTAINTTPHVFKVDRKGQKYYLYLDNNLVYTSPDTSTEVKYIWMGNPSIPPLLIPKWTDFKVDYIRVTQLTPSIPVIFIPGMGGSELQASTDTFWSKDNGHGGTFSHAYAKDEKTWVNQNEAVKPGDDDYFDVLRLKPDGVTSEADLSLTGDLTSQGYGDIDSFFTGMGYTKGTNFFTFAYDWRKDVKSNKDSLDSLIEQAKTTSGQLKVNLVVHSMGGLIARYYTSDSTKASKVNKLIELGVPHLGAVKGLKAILYGSSITYNFYGFAIPIIPSSEVKDVFQNLPSAFQLLPSKSYYDFYNNSDESLPYPFLDDRDIDNNKITGQLSFDQTKNLLANLGHNMTAFGFGEQFHNLVDSTLNQNNGVKIYNIVGSDDDTIGQLVETWLIKWPIKFIPITDEVKIPGDGTVPVYSASLKSDSKDLSGGAEIHHVKQKHEDMPKSTGVSMQTVKAILNDDNFLPVEVKSEKFDLEGKQISVFEGDLDLYDDLDNHTGFNDKGEIETNIPDTSFSAPENSRHAFIKKSSKKIKIKITSKKKDTINTKIRHYQQSKIYKTAIYRDVPITEIAKMEFTLDSTADTFPALTLYPDSTKPESTNITPTSEVSGSSALDQTPPTTSIQILGTKDTSNIYSGPVTVTLTGNDSSSGILKIEYSLDNGVTVQTYSNPFTISTPGKTTLQVKSIDKLGNEEIPQAITVEIAVPPSPTSTSSTTGSSTNEPSSSSNNSNTNTSEESKPTSEVRKFAPTSSDILGISFDNPNHISDEINISDILDELKNPKVPKITGPSAKQLLGGLLIVSAGIITIASFGLATTFFTKPTPK